MTDQLRITEDGRIVSQPVTWDGEPLYSEDSVREGLFDGSAFEQLAGQTALDESADSGSGWRCPRCNHPTLPPAVMPDSYRLCAKCGYHFRPEQAL